MTAEIKPIFFGKEDDEQGWPYKGFSCEKRKEELMNKLEGKLPQIDFKNPELVTISHPGFTKEKMDDIIQGLDNCTGYLFYLISLPPFEIPKILLDRDKPVVLANDLYGGDLAYLKTLNTIKDNQLPVLSISSSNFDDVVDKVKYFEILDNIRGVNSLMINILREEGEHLDQAHYWRKDEKKFFQLAENKLGVTFKYKNIDDLLCRYENIEEEHVKQLTKKWLKNTQEIEEPSEEDVINSAKMYTAIDDLMKEENSVAFTMDCLDLFHKGESPVLPCLAYSQLLDEGRIGTCEADLDCLLTQLLGRELSGNPGFISDPVLDSGRKTIIYAHCVAPTKVCNGERTPSKIRSHAESRSSASRQVIYPEGRTVTTVKLNLLEEKIAVHQGEIVDNIDDEKACRTKVAVEADVDKIAKNWNYNLFGWHRVTFCGDIRKEIFEIAELLNLEVIEEDR